MAGHAPALDAVERAKLQIPEGHGLRKLPGFALAVAVVGIVASLTLAFTGLGGEDGLTQFYFSYLTAFIFFFTMAVGGIFFVLFNVLTRSGWSVTVRRVAENIGGTLPIFIVLFIPIVLGMDHLFHWTHAEHDPILMSKAAYLNKPFFIGRAIFVLLALGWMGWWFRKESVIQDTAGERDVRLAGKPTTSTRRLTQAAGPCIFLFALTVSIAAFDWLMSLQPHWYSTMFGVYLFAGSILIIMALLVLVTMSLQGAGFFGKTITTEHFHDIGKYAFAFIVFWGYIAFSQFMLIWYANIPEETEFYYDRYQGSWMTASRILLFGHFLLPFFFMILRTVKRSRALLFAGSAYLVVLHYLDMRWLVMPVLHPEGQHWSLMDLTTVLAVGGIFVFAVMRLMISAALVPVGDPRLQESLAFENF